MPTGAALHGSQEEPLPERSAQRPHVNAVRPVAGAGYRGNK